MNQQVVIIGAGFAGMWAALSAARIAALHPDAGICVTVIAPQPELRVRPRFYENRPASMVSPLLPLFNATGVSFVTGTVTAVDDGARQVRYTDEQGRESVMAFSKLILASGSQLNRAGIAGADAFAFDIDQAESAERFDQHLRNLAGQEANAARNTFVVCGGGLTGIELATELPARARAVLGDDADIRVIVVERGDKIGGHFSEEMRGAIARASQELGVEWRLNSGAEAVRADGVMLTDGTFIPSQSVILTAGVHASALAARIAGEKDGRGRLHVDDNLRVAGQEHIYATGDVAYAACDDEGRHALMTCQHAIPMGKFAGNNAAAALAGIAPLPYRQPNYVTCVDLGAWGAVYTETWNQDVKAVQDEAKKIKVAITNELIYPPAADKEKAFTQADPLAPFV